MFQLQSIERLSQIQEIYRAMDELYGPQAHFPLDVFLLAAKRHPGFFRIAVDSSGQHIGHVCFLPLNESGYQRMLSPHHSEVDMTTEDIFDKEKDKTLYCFVYSINGSHSLLTKNLVQQTVLEVRECIHSVSEDSIVFAEIVSRAGGLLATRMGMKKYHSYMYENNELEIYKASCQEYLNSFPPALMPPL